MVSLSLDWTLQLILHFDQGTKNGVVVFESCREFGSSVYCHSLCVWHFFVETSIVKLAYIAFEDPFAYSLVNSAPGPNITRLMKFLEGNAPDAGALALKVSTAVVQTS